MAGEKMRKLGFRKEHGLFNNSYFRGNITVLAVSGFFTNLGVGIIGIFMPEYFKNLGETP